MRRQTGQGIEFSCEIRGDGSDDCGDQRERRGNDVSGFHLLLLMRKAARRRDVAGGPCREEDGDRARRQSRVRRTGSVRLGFGGQKISKVRRCCRPDRRHFASEVKG